MTQYVGTQGLAPLLSSSTYDNREAQWFQGPFGMDYDSIR